MPGGFCFQLSPLESCAFLTAHFNSLLGRFVGLPMSDQQLKSFLRRVLKGFSARNYRVTPRLWQPDFGWDHSGVPLAFSMALTTYSGLFDGIKR